MLMFVSGVSVRYCNNVLIVVVDLEMRNQLNQTNLSIYIETLDRCALAGKRAVLHNTAFVFAWRPSVLFFGTTFVLSAASALCQR